MGGPLRAMLLIALLPFASAQTYNSAGRGTYNSHNPDVATSTCTWKESCYAVDYCAIKHNNDDMITFRDGRVCDDLNGEFKVEREHKRVPDLQQSTQGTKVTRRTNST